MNSQLFFYANVIFGILLVLYFLFGRGKTRQPTKLNVKANEDFSKSIVKTKTVANPSTGEAIPAQHSKMTILEPEVRIEQARTVHPVSPPTKNLSIWFVYNGHEWEAHEVLGVPQGAPLPEVTNAYQKLIQSSDPSTFEFFESAYQSILKRWKDRL